MKRASYWLTAIVLFGTSHFAQAQDGLNRSPASTIVPRSTVQVKSAPLTQPHDVPVTTTLPTGETHVPLSTSVLSPTPDMWYYEQLRQDYNNPALQVRKAAEQAAADRRARIAASEWYGMSASRPIAYTTPHMYHYSPTWSSNGRFPYYWGSRAPSPIVVEARRPYGNLSGFGSW